MRTSEAATIAAPARALSPWTWWGVGVAAAAAGMLPWWVHGARLPLQNLWDSPTAPEQMPVVLLPFSQYEVATLAALLLVGSTAMGLVARTRRSRMSPSGVLAALGGALTLQLAAIVQTALTVGAGLRQDRVASVYLMALTAGCLGTVLLGTGMLLAVARGPRPLAAVALSVAAVASGPWLSHLLLGGLAPAAAVPAWLLTALTWLPAALVGVVLAWLGLRTVGQAVAAVAALGVLWLGSALVTAVTSAVGSRVLADVPAEMLDYGLAVLRAALGSFSRELVVAAVCVALLGGAARLVLSRTRARPRP